MNDPSGAFAFFAGIGVLVFLSCSGWAIIQWAKAKFVRGDDIAEAKRRKA